MAAPSPLSRQALLTLLRRHRYAVEATAAVGGWVQAAVVGIAVSDELEIVFDTLADSRKAQNLARDARIALVIGGLLDGENETVQYEGIADRPEGSELGAVQELYFRTFPDGRDRLSWPGLVHYRVRPRWIRYCDYRATPPVVVEMGAGELALLK